MRFGFVWRLLEGLKLWIGFGGLSNDGFAVHELDIQLTSAFLERTPDLVDR